MKKINKLSLSTRNICTFFLFFSIFMLPCQAGLFESETVSSYAAFPNGNLTNSTFHTDAKVIGRNSALYVTREEVSPKPVFTAVDDRGKETGTKKKSESQAGASTSTNADPATQKLQPTDNLKFQWKPALTQAMTFLWIEHSFRLITEHSTRADLRGPFFKDWFQSVRNTRGWRDGDPFLVNYIGHPMQGAVSGYIYVHNDPKSVNQEISMSKAYFKSRMKAMLFSTVYSTQFELGPLSEASIGNVGLRPSHTSKHPSAFVDLVITPTLGTVWLIGEDALDKHVIKRLEDRVENRVVRLLVRSFLNPSRSMANVLRGEWMWHRDGRRL